jgi:hypothetical protein
MGLFDRFREGLGVQRPVPARPADVSADDQAIARYRYLLKTAPPETIEQAHSEAFAQLTSEQRRRLLDELGNALPDAERTAVMRAGDAPDQLARSATRAEIRQPGTMERVYGGLSGAPGAAMPGFGGLFAGSLLASMAGTVLGSAIAQHFFTSHDAGGLFDAAHHASEPAADGRDLTGLGDDFDGGSDVFDDIGGPDTFDV